MNTRIFISYRKGDEPGFSGRLYDRLEEKFSAENLFFDVENIQPGRDFSRELEAEVSRCDILLAIIGKGWLHAVGSDGKARLHNPEDWVRIEIGAALKQGKLVIPVLIGGAIHPSAEDLPHPLWPLAKLQHFKVSHDTFNSDAQTLLSTIEAAMKHIATQKERESKAYLEQGGQLGGWRALSKLQIDERHKTATLPRRLLRLVPRMTEFPHSLSLGKLAFVLDHDEHRGRFLKDILWDTYWGFLPWEVRKGEFLAIKFKIDDNNLADLAPLPATPAAVVDILSGFARQGELPTNSVERARKLFETLSRESVFQTDEPTPAWLWQDQWRKALAILPPEVRATVGDFGFYVKVDKLFEATDIHQGLTPSGRGRSDYASRHLFVNNTKTTALEFEVQHMGAEDDLVLLT